MEKINNDYSKLDYDDNYTKSMDISNKYLKKADISNMNDYDDDKSINTNDTNKTDYYIKGGKRRLTRRNKKRHTKRRKSHTKRRKSHRRK